MTPPRARRGPATSERDTSLCRVAPAKALRFVEFAAVAALALCLTAASWSEAQKIESLIQAVATLKDAQFIRNGSAYDAAAAADHLRTKLRKAGDRVKTADDFIRYCGSVSSMSGEPYQIRYADGHTVTSESFLRAKLKELEQPAN